MRAADEDYSGDDDDPNPSKRRKTGEDGGAYTRVSSPSSVRARAEEIRDRLQDYYAGTYFGSSVASLAYMLAADLNKARNDLLWYCIVGLTDQVSGWRRAVVLCGGGIVVWWWDCCVVVGLW